MTVHLVGAGPGDPALLTVKAADLLRRADVVVFDRLIDTRVLELAPPWAELVDVGKRPGGPVEAQSWINDVLVDRGRRCSCVVRLKGGDPFVFGRGGEEALELRAAGIAVEVVPGITSAVAAPAAAGVLDQRVEAANALVAFVSFCLASSATYLWNDVADRDADARHPRKRLRPVASGALDPTTATVAGGGLLAAGLALSLLATWQLTVVVALYVMVTTAYSLVLKHVAVVDLVAVAAGFVLRAIGGAAATGVPISNWFFIVTSFGSLFVVTGKRSGEAAGLADRAGAVRATLTVYSSSFLAQIRAVSAGVMLVAYCLWAFEQALEAGSRIPLY